MSSAAPDDFYVQSDDEEYLTRCVVDTCLRKFYLYSNIGETREVECDDMDQFMDVLNLIRKVVDDKYVVYAEPL
jgi:hypothetical protein